MMGFFAPAACRASFPEEAVLWAFSVLCVRGLLGAFSRSSSLNFFSSSRSDSLPKEQIPRGIKPPFAAVTAPGSARNPFKRR